MVLLLLIPLSLQTLGLALKTSRPQRLALAALIVALDFHALLFRLDRTHFWLADNIIGPVRMFTALSAVNFLALSRDPQLQYRKRTQSSPAASLSLFHRISWAIDLIMTPRGIGWNHQAPRVPVFLGPRSPTTFVRARLKSIVTMIVYMALVWGTVLYLGLDYTRYGNDSSTVWQHVVLRFLLVSISVFSGRWSIELTSHVMSVFAVILGISTPEEWPDLSGNLRDAYTLRNGWGSVWHQIFRTMVSSYGKFVARNILHLDRGSKISSSVQLWVAFILSAVIHSAGDYVVVGGTLWYSWQFYLLQPIGIAFEDTVISIAGSYGYKRTRWTLLVGYIWVSVWVTATCAGYFGGMFQAKALLEELGE